uniref:Variant surface glycoprotein 1125.1684 n=1 Tax=Trypanosoma brucei TaxID=5691 RepID=A0A1J0R7J5_9TRYP|nr:variant surface glycoprotein 1125.1684 [Trypanosoma brucei]
MLKQAATIALILTQGLVQAAPITTPDPLIAKVTDLCKEQYYLADVKSQLQQSRSRRARERQQLESAATNFKLAAQASPQAEKRCQYGALEAYVQHILSQNKQAADRADDNALAAEEQLAIHIGKLETAQTISTTILADQGSTHGAESTSILRINLKRKAGGTPICSKVTAMIDINPGSTAAQLDAIASIKVAEDTALQSSLFDDWLKISNTASCTNNGNYAKTFATAANGCELNNDETLSGHQNTIKPKRTATDAQLFSSDDQTKPCAEAQQPDANEPLGSAKRIKHTLCYALKTYKASVGSTAAISGQVLKQSNLVLNYLRNCMPKYSNIKKPEDATEAKALIEFVDKTYGESNEKFKEMFVTPLTTAKATIRLNEKTKPKKIVNMVSVEDRAAVISHAEGVRNAKELEAAKKDAPETAIDSKNEEKCKGKPRGECKEDKDCEYKDGKCQVKVTTATGTDGKTNTTASNSFVINKSTLLIAFLIL